MEFYSEFRLTVGWGDCDKAGIVFYPNYYRWFEEGTWSFFDAIHMPMHKIMEEYNSLGFPLVETHANYRSPSRLREKLVVKVKIAELLPKMIKFEHQIFREKTLIVEGYEARIYGTNDPNDSSKLKVEAMPDPVYQNFLKHFKNE